MITFNVTKKFSISKVLKGFALLIEKNGQHYAHYYRNKQALMLAIERYINTARKDIPEKEEEE